MLVLRPFLKIMSTVWAYLHQPLSRSRSSRERIPFKLLNPHRVQQLERCWAKNYEIEQYRILLERCWTREANIG